MNFYCTVDDIDALAVGSYVGEQLTTTGLLFAQGSASAREHFEVDLEAVRRLGVLDDPEGWVLGGDLGNAYFSPGQSCVFLTLVDSLVVDDVPRRLIVDLVSLGAQAVVVTSEWDVPRWLGFGPEQGKVGVFGYSDLMALRADVAESLHLSSLAATEVTREQGSVVLTTSLDHQALESLRTVLSDVLVEPRAEVTLPPAGPVVLEWLATTDRRRLAAEVVAQLRRDEAAKREPYGVAVEFLNALSPDDLLGSM